MADAIIGFAAWAGSAIAQGLAAAGVPTSVAVGVGQAASYTIYYGTVAATSAGLSYVGALLTAPGGIKGPDFGTLPIPNLNWGTPIPHIRGTTRPAQTTLFFNPPFRKWKRKRKIGGQSTWVTDYFATGGYMICDGICDGPIAGIRKIWLDGELMADFSPFAPAEVKQKSADFVDEFITLYLGTDDQAIDPIMNSFHPGLTSAHRGKAYLILNEYDVTQTRRFPNISVEVVADGAGARPMVAGKAPIFNVIAEACLDAGLGTDDFDISDLSGSLRGVSINSIDTMLGKYAAVLSANFTTPTSRGDGVYFLKRPRALHRPEHETPAVIGETGLIVNAFHDIPGREGYFDPNSGTSEGQLMMVRASAHARKVLLAAEPSSAASYLSRAEWMAEALIDTGYLSQPPSTPDLWVPHWLFAADKPIRTQTSVMFYPAEWTAGVCTIPDGAPWYGEKVRTAIKAFANDGSYPLWDNPYAAIIGTEYAIDSQTHTGSEYQVTLTNSGVSGKAPLILIYDIGEEISVGEPYEAWPHWRSIVDGEIACAADSLAWGLDAFKRLYDETAAAKWNDAFAATKQSIIDGFQVDDGRAMFRPQPVTSAFSLSGSFEGSVRAGMSPENWRRDPQTGVIIGSIPSITNPDKWGFPAKGPANGEAQIGRGVTDTIRASDTHIRVIAGASEYMTIYVWIDTASVYSESSRYYAPLTLLGNGDVLETINIPIGNFLTAQSTPDSLSVSDPIYAVGISDWHASSHLLWIKTVRPIPEIPLPWAGYVSPFTINIFNNEIIDWRGSPGSGYQYANIWHIIGNATGVTEVCNFLDAAQDAYETKYPGNRGPFAPVYVWDRADAQDLGTPNTWVWNWYDPNTKWGGYQYRPLENVARCAYESGNAAAKTIATDFLTWIDTNWTSSANGPPTNFPSTGTPTREYEEPHFAVLIMRAALWGELAGISTTLCRALVQRAWDYLETQYVTTGTMTGTWSPNENDWFGFWHAEIIEALAMLLDEGSATRVALAISDVTIRSRLVASDVWLTQNTRVVSDFTEDDFGASEGDNGDPALFQHLVNDPKSVPQEVRLHFADITADYVRNTRSYRPVNADSSSTLDFQLPLAMTPAEAEEMAIRIGRIAEQGRNQYALTGSLAQLPYEAGDILPVVLKGQRLDLAIEGGAFGWPGLMPMETVEQDARVYRQAVKVAAAAVRGGSSIQNPGVTDHIVLDIPSFDSNLPPGLHIALYGTAGAWQSAELYESRDGGVTYEFVDSEEVGTDTGIITGTLADGPTSIIDRANTITVVMEQGVLTSTSDTLLLASDTNLCAIGSEANGWEIMKFRDADLVGTDTYDLTHLVRGLKGTEHMTGIHVAGEHFVLLSALTLYVADMQEDLGVLRKFKAVTNGDLLDDTAAFDAVDTGEALRPYSPALFRATRDGAGNITFTWARRDRNGVTLPWSGVFPMSEESEAYEIDIYDGATVKRTITATSETATYTAAEQNADFAALQDPVDAEVFQMGAIGRGTGERKNL